MTKQRVGILFGGVNTEHDISIISAKYLFSEIDTEQYDVTLVYLDRRGNWFLSDWDEAGQVRLLSQALSIKPQSKTLNLSADLNMVLDVVFPVFHGEFGEDGCIQGLFETLQIPYVGCGVLASSVAMDKDMTKRVIAQLAVPVLSYQICFRDVLADVVTFQQRIMTTFTYPIFVKPAYGGSSVGISKVKCAADFDDALHHAFQYADKVMIEQGLDRPREIEVALLGDSLAPQAMGCGEVIPNSEFYDYQAKYIDGKEELLVPAPLDSNSSATIQAYAEQVFRALGCYGFARADFLLDQKTNQVYFSEINPIPGLTPISLFPKLCQRQGLTGAAWIDRLVQLALTRYHNRQNNLLMNYDYATLSS